MPPIHPLVVRRRPGALGILSIVAMAFSVLALVTSLVLPPLLAPSGDNASAAPSEVATAPTPPPTSTPSPSVAPSATATPSPSSTPDAPPTPAETALAQLAALPATDASVWVPDYRRDAFGEAWEDVDGNGCSQRNDVLARDLEQVVMFADRVCTVQTGVLHDPYTGATIAFQHGPQTSQAVQIDHLIPLALAWRSGAWAWTPEQMLAFANDTSLLLAVEGEINQSRSDSDFDEWMPPVVEERCGYVITIVGGLSEYGLSITASSRAAAEAVLVGCGDEVGIVPVA